MTSLSEMVLAVALALAVDGLEEGRWVADDTIGYSRTSSGNEIDFSPVRVPTEAGAGLTTPIESKWVDDGWRREALVLEGRYGRGVMATKSILDLTHPSWAIPAPLVACLLLLLGKEALPSGDFRRTLYPGPGLVMDVATLTAKGQVTVPKAVRDALGLRQGDQLSWELEDGSVRVRAVAPLDVAYLQGLEGTLSEWSSTADDQAFAEL